MLDRDGAPRWSPLWEGNPRIAKPGERGDFLRLVNGPGCRPYLDYARMRADFEVVYPGRPFRMKVRDPRLPYRFTAHRVTRGELQCFERLTPLGYVVIEPHHKPGQPNRDWGWARWQAVVDACPLDWVQINPRGARVLRGVRHVPADSFIAACRLLSGARAYVGPEGGLYHAAAALGIPAIAVFGGFVSPATQGYDAPEIVNLYVPQGSPCGQRVACAHCRDALDRITPEMVIEHVRALPG